MSISLGGITKATADNSYAPITGVESFGAKLRRLAVAARYSNAYALPPMVAPPAWQASTAYVVGKVVTNGGNAYMCLIAGTSAASGGPTGTLVNPNITDNTAAWTYYGPNVAGPADGTIPTYASSTTASSLTNIYHPGTTPQFFKVWGATGVTSGTSLQLVRFNQLGAGSAATGDARVAFHTDAAQIAIKLAANAIARVRIDGRFYSRDMLATSTSVSTYHTFDFTAAGGRRPRLIEVEFSKGTAFFADIYVGASDTIWAPSTGDAVRALFVSDSIFAGSTFGPNAFTVPQMVGGKLGWADCWNYSTGGTGYVEPSTFEVYGDRIAQGLALSPNVWVFMGSFNDRTYTSAQITAAALACFQSIRAGGSTAPIVVFGVWPTDNAGTGITDTQILAVEVAVQAAVTAFADAKTFFIPIRQDASLPWITTANNNSAHTGFTNQTTYVASDYKHPADIGSEYLADRMAAAIRGSVLPALT